MSRVLFATSEVFPLVKTGGLADVSASLPQALQALGHEVHLLLPGYRGALATAALHGLQPRARLTVQGHEVTLWQGRLPGTPLESPVVLWLVDAPAFFDRPGSPYQDSDGTDWPDNAQRFHLFAEVACRLALDQAGLDWRPDLVHCNDWQTGLIPALLASQPHRPATLFTLHNLAYRGLFPYSTFQALGLPETLWRFDGLEFHGQLALIKGGLAYADHLTTVSPTYAREIQTPNHGQGLEGLLQHRRDKLHGILNGIDAQTWDPRRDRYLSAPYGPGQMAGKAACKQDLQQSLGLPANAATPLLGFIGRLADQKGVDLIIAVLPRLLEARVQVAILGAGAADLEAALRALAQRHPNQMAVRIGLDESLAHRLTAGADIFLMPSRFEPCGLNQMYSLRYGTVPVVHAVGGLRDTVLDPSEVGDSERGADEVVAGGPNGFCFHTPMAAAFWTALVRCLTAYRTPAVWQALQRQGMGENFSWTASALAYTEVYRLAIAERAEADGPSGQDL